MRRRDFLATSLFGGAVIGRSQTTDAPRVWAESAHLNGASADGKTAFIIRLARYPGLQRAWLWAFVFLPDGVYAYNDDTLRLTGFQDVTPVERERVVYELPGAIQARLHRDGPRNAIVKSSASVKVKAHHSSTPPVGAGAETLRIEASFEPTHRAQSRTTSRTEVLGKAEAKIHLPGRTISFAGGGHWHEQHGDRPRFAPTLTYATLRGERISFIAITTAKGDSGFLLTGDKVRAVEQFVIEPPGAKRAFRLRLEGGEVVEGTFTVVHSYSMSIEGRRRPGAIGVAETKYGALSGMINDWKSG